MRISRIIAGIALALVAASACSEKEEDVKKDILYYSDSESISIPMEGASRTIVFRANCAWTLEIPSDASSWISADVLKASAPSVASSFKVKLTIAENTSGEKRQAELKLKYGSKDLFKKIDVSQSGSKAVYQRIDVKTITDDMIFSTVAAGTSTSVSQGFDFNEDASMVYFSQVTSGYKNTISWTKRQAITTSTALASNKMTLLYFSHGNNIRYEKGSDGNDYLWIANYGTRDSEDKYGNAQILSRIKLINGTTLKNTQTTENYYFGIRNLHVSFDLENDHVAIYSGYYVTVYKLSEVLACPETDITLPVSLTYGGGTSKVAPDAEWTGKPVVRAHDCSKLTPVTKIYYNYSSAGRSWQTMVINGDRIYFFLDYSSPTNGMAYQSVIDIFDLSGKKIKSDIKQPFVDNMDDLVRYGWSDSATKYMENEAFLIRNGVLYLEYTAKNAAGFRRPVVFQLDLDSLEN